MNYNETEISNNDILIQENIKISNELNLASSNELLNQVNIFIKTNCLV